MDALYIGPCPTCSVCQRDAGMAPRQFYRAVTEGRATSCDTFSWQPCDICGSRAGGSREPIHERLGGELEHVGSACIDCVLDDAVGALAH